MSEIFWDVQEERHLISPALTYMESLIQHLRIFW